MQNEIEQTFPSQALLCMQSCRFHKDGLRRGRPSSPARTPPSPTAPHRPLPPPIWNLPVARLQGRPGRGIRPSAAYGCRTRTVRHLCALGPVMCSWCISTSETAGVKGSKGAPSWAQDTGDTVPPVRPLRVPGSWGVRLPVRPTCPLSGSFSCKKGLGPGLRARPSLCAHSLCEPHPLPGTPLTRRQPVWL